MDQIQVCILCFIIIKVLLASSLASMYRIMSIINLPVRTYLYLPGIAQTRVFGEKIAWRARNKKRDLSRAITQ